MTRMATVTAFAALLLGSVTAYAANQTMASNTSATQPSTDYTAQCSSLASQWQTAEAAHMTNPNLGKAKADAAKGEKLCKSTNVSQHKRGASDYRAALKLLGVTPV